MNNPFAYMPDEGCATAFRELIGRIEALRGSDKPEDVHFCREVDGGKMLGVLIAEDAAGERHTLYAFSGQLGCKGFSFPGFVAPVFDYLQPDGYFKKHERLISQQNREIREFEGVTLQRARNDYDARKKSLDDEVTVFKKECELSKQKRNHRRESGEADENELAEMIRQSQFEKAVLRRMKIRNAEILRPYADRMGNSEDTLRRMKEKRRLDSEKLQRWLFENFRLLNARGESKSLANIFAATPLKIPPSGAGECCAPKLLQEAYMRKWTPISIAEYWYGAPKNGEIRRHGEHYPACRGKCLPILEWMLQGVEVLPPLGEDIEAMTLSDPVILYENEYFCVVNKPSGMLSVPGKGKRLSLQHWLEERYGAERFVKPVHRLDQDTSGLIVAALDETSFKLLQSMFERRQMTKTYVALLAGDYQERGIERKGRIILPLVADWLDRPRQRVDIEAGKPAETEYEFIGVEEGRSRVIFHPHTGRTHQLRVHSASEHGLGIPIAGDRLYGRAGGADAQRLMLHAHELSFVWPLNNEHYTFEASVPF